MGVEVSLAGRVAISADGVLIDESRFPARQGRLVFAYLVAEQGRPVPRDELAEALWGDSPPVSWQKALTGIVSKLRGLLTECGLDGSKALTSAFGCYRLDLPEGCSVDVLAATGAIRKAERALAAGDLAAAEAGATRASAVARGRFLPGDEGAWVDEKRRELADVLGRALLCLGDVALAAGDPAAAVRWSNEAVALDPFRETGYRRLMQAHAAAGDRAEALRVYERCRRLLADELGAFPSPETESIYRELLEAPRPSPTPNSDAMSLPSEPKPVDVRRKLRRTLTVVRAEPSGWAAVVERLDPEAAHDVISRCYERADRVVGRHGGVVTPFTGETITALFGVAAVHEDDALRAARAALDLRSELASLAEEVRGDLGIDLGVKLAIDTGEVVVEFGAASEPIVVGSVIKTTERLARAAKPGDIVIGAEARRVIAHAVETRRLTDVPDLGEVWYLTGLAADDPHIAARFPFVGREQELHTLGDVFARAIEERSCRLCTLVGPPGIGKSRLTREFLNRSAYPATVAVGRCLAYGEGITYWPLREIIRGLAEGEPRAWVKKKLRDEAIARAVAERVAAATGASAAGAAAQETFWAFRRLVEALARERPLVLAIDDVHWAEPNMLDLVENVVGLSSGAPIMILCLARPELLEKRPEWTVPHANRTLISLGPLGAAEARGLVERLERARELPQQARTRAIAAAEGNPLFLEQLIAHESEGRTTGLPPSIHALLDARIDRLGAGERDVLERASIQGRAFSPEAVAELLPIDQRPRLDDRLLSLVRGDFIEPHPSPPGTSESFRFRHILLRDAAYEAMSKESRAGLHERYADFLEARRGEDEIVGYHLERSCRYRDELGQSRGRTGLALRAADRLGEAGRAALKRGDTAGAVNLLSRATALPPPDTPERIRLLPDLGEALSSNGELARARGVVDEALEQAEAAHDDHAAWRARLQQAWLRFQADPNVDVAEVLSDANAAVDAFERLRDDRALAHAWHLTAWLQMDYGRLSALDDAVRRGREHARAAGDAMTEEELTVWALLAGITGPLPADRLRRDAEAELERARSRGSRRVEGAALLVLAICAAFDERFDEARTRLAEATAIDEELSGRGSGFRYTPAGMIEVLAGDQTGAERELRAGYERLREQGDAWFLCGVAAELADVLWLQGRDEEAYELTVLSEELVAEDVLVAQMMWRGARAKILAGRGQANEAEALAREGIAIIERTDHVVYQADAWSDLAEVLRLERRPDAAAAAAERARSLYETKGNVAAARKLRTMLDELRAPTAAGTPLGRGRQ